MKIICLQDTESDGEDVVEVDEDYEEDEDDEEVSVNQLFKEAIRSHSSDKE